MTEKKAEKDSLIFQEGDVADVAYYITSGKVQLFQSDRGQINLLKIVGDNEVFGELAAFDSETLRPYSAKALEECSLLPISAQDLQKVVEAAPKPIQALFSLARDKMKLGKTKAIAKKDIALDTSVKNITIKGDGEKLKAQVKAQQVPLMNLPYRIGGYHENGESNRRDTLHLSIPMQSSPLKVSRQHCEIAIEDGMLVVVDLGSRFGTVVNGTTIGRGRGVYSCPLKKGDNKITLGGVEDNYNLAVTCE